MTTTSMDVDTVVSRARAWLESQDILGLIFTLLLDTDEWSLLCLRRRALCCVCHAWRSFIHSFPLAWRRIFIVAHMNKRYIDLQFRNAQDCPTIVILDLSAIDLVLLAPGVSPYHSRLEESARYSDDALDAIKAAAPTIQSLSIRVSGNRTWLFTTDRLSAVQFPLLKSLLLSYSPFSHEALHDTPPRPLNAPFLEKLVLDRVSIEAAPSLRHLTSLTLEGLNKYDMRIGETTRIAIETSILLALGQTTALTHLRMKNVDMTEDELFYVVLSHLTSLSLSCDQSHRRSHRCGRLLSYIITKQLVELELNLDVRVCVADFLRLNEPLASKVHKLSIIGSYHNYVFGPTSTDFLAFSSLQSVDLTRITRVARFSISTSPETSNIHLNLLMTLLNLPAMRTLRIPHSLTVPDTQFMTVIEEVVTRVFPPLNNPYQGEIIEDHALCRLHDHSFCTTSSLHICNPKWPMHEDCTIHRRTVGVCRLQHLGWSCADTQHARCAVAWSYGALGLMSSPTHSTSPAPSITSRVSTGANGGRTTVFTPPPKWFQSP
ncbi:hypothetical protein HMN09_00194300 [Mycena chlorophos]|uniref:F-box domain-containing protein n=1 Tax=Mycena chlorophos TaxID=658473 RepID=A0A8H6WQR0_MYCCL|nr:hypothetical protein HMN09_00194300 [Mycena chlorophos]